jgi:hypothetical protein
MLPRSKSWSLVAIATIAVGFCAARIAQSVEPTRGQPSNPFRLVQSPGQADGNAKPKKRSYTDDGIVSAVTPESISVVAKKKLWMLQIKPGCVIEVTGEAELSYLKPGMLVRIYGDFDKRYKAVTPIAQLEIVSAQTANVTPGIFPDTLPPVDEPEKGKKAAAKKKAPPDDPNAMKDPNAAQDPNAAKDPDDRAKDPADPAIDPDDPNAKTSNDAGKPMMIVGQLKVLKDGEMIISASDRIVRAQLTETPEIRVSLTDFTLAKRGDALTKFHCEYVTTGAGVTDLLMIQLTNPLEGPKKPTKKAPTKTKAAAKQPANAGKTK